MGGTPAYMAPEMATGPVEKIDDGQRRLSARRDPVRDHQRQAAALGQDGDGVPDGRRQEPDRAAGESQRIAGNRTEGDGDQPAERYQTVHKFQDALRVYQSHSESIVLTDSAERNLNAAETSGEYEMFSRALYGFEEALAMWDGNQRAARLLSACALAYAQAALKRDDFDLGISLLDAANPQHKVLLEQLQAGQRERDSRVRRLAMLKRLVAALLLAVAGVVSVALVMVRAERDEAIVQRNRAEEAEDVAQENYEDAEAARKVAETERKRAEEEEDKATAAKEAEEYEAYVARIGLANAKVTENAFDRAAALLAECDPEHKNWEWGRLAYLCNLSATDLANGWPCRSRGVFAEWESVR